MTTSEDGRSPDAATGLAARAAHSAIPLMTVYVLAQAWIVYRPVPGWVSFLLLIAFFALVIAMSHHDVSARLCTSCITEVPHDAAVRAAGDRLWTLRLYHLAVTWRGLLFWLGCVVVVSSTAAWLEWRWLNLLPLAALFAFEFSVVWHRRLRSWCPWCRDRGPGWDDVAPIPVPDPAGTKSA